ncbi:hypothetical protein [Mesorhizobium sp. GR13]|uniref:hypothetical protein n=1 Tax=Mesorhizobium sp. GR13 TaxID=2562308 RepID=UPI0010C0093C|nr:hypothetical protein [Mesorhizobium sp. GR13]
MSGKESLSLEEFATAPRKQRSTPVLNPVHAENEQVADAETVSQSAAVGDQGKAGITSEASKALRQMKRARMKGVSHFVNVNLDRETKKRLKLASFNMDTSMQAIMEKAIRHYLDTNGY